MTSFVLKPFKLKKKRNLKKILRKKMSCHFSPEELINSRRKDKASSEDQEG